MPGGYFETRRDGETLELSLRGEWQAGTLRAIRAEQSALDLAGVLTFVNPTDD